MAIPKVLTVTDWCVVVHADPEKRIRGVIRVRKDIDEETGEWQPARVTFRGAANIMSDTAHKYGVVLIEAGMIAKLLDEHCEIFKLGFDKDAARVYLKGVFNNENIDGF